MVYAKFSGKRPPYMVFCAPKNRQIWRLSKIGESPDQNINQDKKQVKFHLFLLSI
jgi:hypothetical protein